MFKYNCFEKLVGKRFSTLEELENKMKELCGKNVHCSEPDPTIIKDMDEIVKETDFMIYYEVEDDGDVYTLFYLVGNGKNKYYITEV